MKKTPPLSQEQIIDPDVYSRSLARDLGLELIDTTPNPQIRLKLGQMVPVDSTPIRGSCDQRAAEDPAT